MSSQFDGRADFESSIRYSNEYPGNEQARTVMYVLEETVAKYPHRNALAIKGTQQGAQWLFWTYTQYLEDVKKAARALIEVGLERFHGVGILGFNSPEWFISDIAAIYAGGFAVGIYTTNSPEACGYVARDCKAQVIIVEDEKQLKKILQVRDQLPDLKAIVQYTGEVKGTHEKVYNWKDFMALGEGDKHKQELDNRIAQQKPGHCCTLIYTSGTTGDPKGVMLSHDNMTWTPRRVSDCLEIGEEHVVSYLPLSHVAAQMLDIHLPIYVGGTVWFARPDALKGSLVDTLKEVRPTIFLGVPRVWEKIHEKMKEVGKNTPAPLKWIADAAKEIGLEGNKNIEKGEEVPWGFWLSKVLVFDNIRKALGLDRSKIQITGAAPISRETIDYFMSINIPLSDIYGMSESSAIETACFPGKWKSGTSGTAVPGIQIRIASNKEGEDGEIQFYGRHVMMGYLGKPEKTAETFTPDGWLMSGDIGHLDKEGFLYITGRIKELLITAGGENIPPVQIENEVKEELPILSNCMLVGDKKKFLVLLVALKSEVDPEGTPIDKLTHFSIDILESLGSSSKTVTDAIKDEKLKKHVEEGISKRNMRAISNAQKIQKFVILPADFSIAGGELGPTLKLKRNVVLQKYAQIIDSLYDGAE